MEKVYWSFGDFIKSSSFPAINTLDITNGNMAKEKISRLEIFQLRVSGNFIS